MADAYRQASKLHTATLSARIPLARKIQLLAKVKNIINSGIPPPKSMQPNHLSLEPCTQSQSLINQWFMSVHSKESLVAFLISLAEELMTVDAVLLVVELIVERVESISAIQS